MSDILQKIKSWFEKIKTKGASYKNHGINPASEWSFILLGTFILLFFGAVGAFYFYLQVDGGKIFVVTKNNNQQEVKIDTNLLQKTVDDINSRADSLKKINTNGTIPPEPSI